MWHQLIPKRVLSSNAAFSGLKLTRSAELVREFIHDSLYNERDGYFQRHVNIFSANNGPLPFTELRDHEEYSRRLYEMYKEQTSALKFYQLWHTPSELFRPWYAQGLAEYVKRQARNDPVIIYEVGPGNGTLCDDICDFYKVQYPEIYDRLEYHLIEISHHLVQTRLLSLQKRHHGKIHIHNKSFLDWNIMEPRRVFVFAIEMFDNLPQDRVRFAADGALEQAMVVTNDDAKFGDRQAKYSEVFVPAEDPLIIEVVNALDSVGHDWPSTKRRLSSIFSKVWPMTLFQFDQPWESEFIPTGPYRFMKQLVRFFPKHHFLMTDFDALPETIEGHGGPTVQTRYEGDTVSCTTYLLQRGLFDIFFPLKFPVLGALYKHLSGNKVKLFKQREFCQENANVLKTKTKSGYNPMLDDFENVSFLATLEDATVD
ncbi:hypothetical protein PSACC_03180 [Paramicrosporidium saccamoebae]|uniref:Protein arginine methyltransferase NDUFAF7 n=1 Tax=Paramicrosporidium saccamoebae TaxID=1246581 RepID=A0A2H9TGX0_9FUNG|nr:hypothetical protein PSACC_03180 [Paramicrosporidium saccamoebae]